MRLLFLEILGKRLKKPLGKRARTERLQVVNSLAHPNKFHGNIQIVLYGKHDAASRRSVKLSEGYARNFSDILEFLCLAYGVLTRRSVKYQKHLAVGIRKLPVNDLIDFRKLVHQVFLVVESARRVTDNDIAVSRLCCRYRIKNNGGGVGALLVLDYFDSGSFSPYLELIDSRGAKRIRSGYDNFFVPSLVHRRHFAYRGSLAYAVYAYNKYYRRDGDKPHILAALKHLCDDLNDFLPYLFGVCYTVFTHAVI